jgi:hypothetical protein
MAIYSVPGALYRRVLGNGNRRYGTEATDSPIADTLIAPQPTYPLPEPLRSSPPHTLGLILAP